MAFAKTTTYLKLRKMRKFYRILQGGMSAGKTIAVLLFLVSYAQNHKGERITVVSATANQLRDGAMRDFRDILAAQKLEPFFEFRATDKIFIYTPTETEIQFLALDDEMKARGARRDVLFVNEANRLKYKLFDQLSSRTRKFCIIDFNPSSRFWAHDELLKKFRDDCDFQIFTYKDNERLSAREVKNIESHDHNSNWWRVYGEGQIGELESNIFKGWTALDELPKNAELENYGLDFGFEHPTALTAIYRDADGLIFCEMIYQSNLTPEAIVATVTDVVSRNGDASIICDGARPEIISQMKMAGLRAVPANKNAGSVLRGIGQIQDLKNVRYIGKNIEREYLSYAWREKADGTKIEEPVKMNDDAMDSIRYAVDDLTAAKKREDAIAKQWEGFAGSDEDDFRENDLTMF